MRALTARVGKVHLELAVPTLSGKIKRWLSEVLAEIQGHFLETRRAARRGEPDMTMVCQRTSRTCLTATPWSSKGGVRSSRGSGDGDGGSVLSPNTLDMYGRDWRSRSTLREAGLAWLHVQSA